MHVLIHTYGRHDRQITWQNLSPSIRERAVLVVQKREEHLYPNYPTVVLPPHLTKLAETRQWLMEHFLGDHVCILDDDLQFAVRRQDDRTKFRQPVDRDIDELFVSLEAALFDGIPLVGVGAREGGNRNTESTLSATRQMRIHAIDTQTYARLGVRFDRVEVMEDFDVTLQFLRGGCPNVVLNDWVTNQGGSNTSGGCSHYRDPQCQERAARRLAELHPGFVKVVRKQTKTSWGGQERYDVIVQWKRARNSGLLVSGKGESPTGEGSGGTEALE